MERSVWWLNILLKLALGIVKYGNMSHVVSYCSRLALMFKHDSYLIVEYYMYGMLANCDGMLAQNVGYAMLAKCNDFLHLTGSFIISSE